MEEAYLLCKSPRKEWGRSKIGSPAGDPRPDGAESPRLARAAARLGYRPASIEWGNGLHLASETSATEMDYFRECVESR